MKIKIHPKPKTTTENKLNLCLRQSHYIKAANICWQSFTSTKTVKSRS